MMIFALLLLFLVACEKESGPLNPAGKIRTTKVDPPRSVRIEKGEGNSVDIRWSAPASDAGFSGRYNIQLKRRSRATYNFSYETQERTYNVNVIRDTTYDYRVRSLAAAGWEPSDWVTTEYTLTGVAVENSARGAPANAVVAIPDEALRQYIERVLKKNRGATITHADMRKIVNLLDGHGLGVESLVGLEAATNLQNVAMGWNRISDLTPLVHLPKLRYLYLIGNPFLNDVSINEHVPALQRRGVEVVLSPYERRFPDSPFDIELVFLDDFTEDEQEMWRRIARRWAAAIQMDAPDYTFSRAHSFYCGDHFVTIPAGEQIDDLRIYITTTKFREIDDIGPNEIIIMGAASAVLVRSNLISLAGCVRMRYKDDFNTGLHEVGHVLGIGTTWDRMIRDRYSADTHFAGPQAIAAFDQAGGTDYQGAKVPLEKDGIHWRTSVLSRELMSISPRHDVLSAITLGALSDLGYTVDFSMADPYELPPPGAAKPVADAVPFCLVERLHPPVYVDD